MQAIHDLGDYADFLRELEEHGILFAVIGGCAVGGYARLMGETVLSGDLDIYLPQESLNDLLAWLRRRGAEIRKRPRPRSVPVAVFFWDGKEVNALSSSQALPAPQIVARTAREFVLSKHGGVVVPVADPFDLLANKLAVAREKDRPHIEILRRFCEEEAVAALSQEQGRQRLLPARRLLEVLNRTTLTSELAERLIERAAEPIDYRFLISKVPLERQARRLLDQAPELPELHAELSAIFASRKFERG